MPPPGDAAVLAQPTGAASPPDGAEKARRERRACSACHDPGADVQNTQLRSTAKDYG
jgi:cytochrome c551/c552